MGKNSWAGDGWVRGERENIGRDRELLCRLEFKAGTVFGISVTGMDGCYFVTEVHI